MDNKKIIVTGGSGFIGGWLIRKLLKDNNNLIFNIDKLNYSADKCTLETFKLNKNFNHINLDLIKGDKIKDAVINIEPDIIFHLAAESHVDRSIKEPINFINSNIVGTFNLLEASRYYFDKISTKKKSYFKFIHVSTDEVFGTLGDEGKFNENSKYNPRSPYSASKASSDHLVKAWHSTYNFPAIITNCSNNYGPFQFPEKLIPVVIKNCIYKKSIPIYGDGRNVRDWLFVEDHVEALLLISKKGKIGDSYCVGGFGELENNLLIKKICEIMDELLPFEKKYSNLVEFIKDRPGHDKRYSINSNKIQKELGWKPKVTLREGLRKQLNGILKT